MRPTPLALLGLLACAPKPPPTGPPPGAGPADEPPEPVETTVERYVAAPDAIELYAEPGGLGDPLAELAWGAALTARGDAAQPWVEVTWDGAQGFVDASALVTIPPPPLEPADHVTRGVEAYVDALRAAGLPAELRITEEDEGPPSLRLRLPTASFEETFLLIKPLLGVPMEYPFPEAGELVLSTPEAPSEAAVAGPYDYVTHRLSRVEQDGALTELVYYDDSEVGGRELRISRAESGFQVTQRSWTH